MSEWLMEIMYNELSLTTKQTTNLRSPIEKNISTDIKLSNIKAQISKINQSRGFLESFLIKLAGSLMKVTVPLAKNI